MGQTIAEQAYAEKWSTAKIANELLKNGTGSPDRQSLKDVLQIRQQEKMLQKTGWLVIGTWVMALATWALALVS